MSESTPALKPISFYALTTFLILGGILFFTTPSTPAAADQLADPAPNCEYGIALDAVHPDNIATVGAGWGVTFSATGFPTLANGAEFVPIVRFDPIFSGEQRLPGYTVSPPLTESGLGKLVDDNQGKLWLLGNEVDRKDVQDDLMPVDYAKAYHDTYRFIKSRDPYAQIAISGLVQVTPGRLQYLDLVRQSYSQQFGTEIPVDVWNMHVYIIPEANLINGVLSDAEAAIANGTDPNLAILGSGLQASQCGLPNVYCYADHTNISIFQHQVTLMRQWMKDRGMQDKPLILSEFGTLHPYDQEGDSDPNTCFLKDEFGNCYGPARVSQFMVETVNFLQNATDPNLGYPEDGYRLVQQWLWFGSNYENGGPEISSTKLWNQDGSLTQMGNQYRSLIMQQPVSVDFEVVRLNAATAEIVAPATTADATVTAVVRNVGNTLSTQPLTLNFYDENDALVGSVQLPAEATGCGNRTYTIEFEWTGLSAGVHPLRVVASSGEDAGVSNNVANSLVIVGGDNVYLPGINGQ